MKYSEVEDKTKIEKPLEIGETKSFVIKTIDKDSRRITLTL
jgi:ribosomal protein S1